MIRVICNLKDKTMNVIDDAECTPGQSRQLTEFKNYILMNMQRQWNKVSKTSIESELMNVANIPINNGFKLLKSESKNGCAILTYDVETRR